MLDELQQSIGEQPDRALAVQEIVEACSTRFGSRILFVGTGQAALEATPQLAKLQDRFTVRVSLEDKDVERVVREVVLRKAPDKVPALQDVLDAASGEINRHLAGSQDRAKPAPTAGPCAGLPAAAHAGGASGSARCAPLTGRAPPRNCAPNCAWCTRRRRASRPGRWVPWSALTPSMTNRSRPCYRAGAVAGIAAA